MIKLKDLLNEELLGTIYWRGKELEIYKNPKSIKRMTAELRAISYPNGDLFVVDDSYNIMHTDLARWLKDKGFPNSDTGSYSSLIKMLKDGYITWQRYGKTNIFKLGESMLLGNSEIEELLPIIEKYTKKVKQKNSQYKFLLENIYD